MGCSGCCQPCGDTPVSAPRIRWRDVGARCRSTPPEPTSRSTSRRSFPVRSTTRELSPSVASRRQLGSDPRAGAGRWWLQPRRSARPRGARRRCPARRTARRLVVRRRDGGRRPSSPSAWPASQVLSALQRMPRSPSTVRVTGVVATTSRESPASSGSSSTTEWTSWWPRRCRPPQPAPLTRPGRARLCCQHLDTGEHQVGRRAAHHRREVGTLAQVLAPDHVGQEHLADGLPRGLRAEYADARDHVVRDHDRQVAQHVDHLGVGSRRCRRLRPDRASRPQGSGERPSRCRPRHHRRCHP